MKFNLQDRRTRLLMIFLLPFFLIILFGIFYFSESDLGITDLKVTNVTNSSATITWTTEKPTKAEVLVSENDSWKFLEPLFSNKETFYDDRNVELNENGEFEYSSEIAKDRTIHHVTINNLEENTKYYFRIKGNLKTFSFENLDSFETEIIPDEVVAPDTAYGEVLNFSNFDDPVNGVAVYYITSKDNNRISDKFSTLIDKSSIAIDINQAINSIPSDLIGVESDNLVVEATTEFGNGFQKYDLSSESIKPLEPIYINYSYNPEASATTKVSQNAFPDTIEWPITDVSVTDNCCGIDRQCTEQHEWEAGFYDYAAGKCGGGGSSGGGGSTNTTTSTPPPSNSKDNSGTSKWTCGPVNFGTHCVDTNGTARCVSTYMEACGSDLYRRIECGSGGEFRDFHGCIFDANGNVKTTEEEAAKKLTCPLGSWPNDAGTKCISKDSNGNIQEDDLKENGFNETIHPDKDREDAKTDLAPENDSVVSTGSGSDSGGESTESGSVFSLSELPPDSSAVNLLEYYNGGTDSPGNFNNSSCNDAFRLIKYLNQGNGEIICEHITMGSRFRYRLATCKENICHKLNEAFQSKVIKAATQAAQQYNNLPVYTTNTYIGGCPAVSTSDICKLQNSDESQALYYVGSNGFDKCEYLFTYIYTSGPAENQKIFVPQHTSNFDDVQSKVQCPSFKFVDPSISNEDSINETSNNNSVQSCYESYSCPTPNISCSVNSVRTVKKSLNDGKFRCNLEFLDSEGNEFEIPEQTYQNVDCSGGEPKVTNFELQCPNLEGRNSIFSKVSAQSEQPPTPTSIDPNLLSSGKYSITMEGFNTAELEIFSNNVTVNYYVDINGDGQKQPEEPLIDPTNYGVSISKETEIFTHEFVKGWNLISMPFISTEINTARGLLEELWKQRIYGVQISKYSDGKGVNYVARFNANSEVEEFGSNFNLIPGEAYFVRNLDSGVFILEGSAFTSSVPINLSNGWNLIGIQAPATNYSAESFLNMCTEQGAQCVNISRFRNQRYESYVSDEGTFFGNNFNIFNSEGYFILNNGDNKVITP